MPKSPAVSPQPFDQSLKYRQLIPPLLSPLLIIVIVAAVAHIAVQLYIIHAATSVYYIIQNLKKTKQR